MIEITNLTKFKINKNFFKKIVKNVLKKEGKKFDISIVFLGKQKIKKINKIYLKKNQPTDVLVFKLEKNWAEIVLCPEVIKKNAKKYKTSFQKELLNCLLHGIFHLFGFEDKTKKGKEKMEKKQKFYLLKIYAKT